MESELLAPAGNYSKLKTALHFGADAVYVGGKNFSLRTYADNFTDVELCSGIELAHSLGKKVYVAVNIFAKNSDFSELEKYFKFLNHSGVDGIIVSDTGVIYMAKNSAPDLAIHLSTQANTTNKYTVKFWQEQGLSRVVLARELSLNEIQEIHSFCPTMELEAFIHGAMCISYSGRCLLSNYLDGRESNRGACVQACRWKYQIKPILPDPKEDVLQLEEDDKGSYILNSKDLNLIDYLEDMKKAGVCSFKIEGRMKSEYYLATVINAYRQALDNGVSDSARQELGKIAHREYTTAYALGKNDKTINYDNAQTKGDCEFIANIVGYENGCLLAEMRGRFKVGESLEVLSNNPINNQSFIVKQIFDSKGNETDDAKLVQEIYRIPCDIKAVEGDILRRKRK